MCRGVELVCNASFLGQALDILINYRISAFGFRPALVGGEQFRLCRRHQPDRWNRQRLVYKAMSFLSCLSFSHENDRCSADIDLRVSATMHHVDFAREEAMVAELSWYGEATLPLPWVNTAGQRLMSSQVGKIAPSHRPRWSHGRRLAADPALDALLAPAIAFEQLPDRLSSIFDAKSDAVCQLIQYSEA